MGDGAENKPAEPDLGNASEGRAMSHETPNWGIEPVPERLRLLGLFDTSLLWSSLGLSLLVLVAGTLLVPASRSGTLFWRSSSGVSSATRCSPSPG